MNYDALFNPFQYKGLTLHNRFVMAPMTRMFAADGVPAQINADYYARRAAAGVGLILTEGTTINRPASKNAKDIPDFHGNAALDGWKQVVQSVHAAGGAIAPQIWHVGKVLNGMTDWLPPAPLETPDEMTTEDIYATIKAFGQGAKAAQEVGFDAFEIHGAHGYLIDQFFWDEMNHRTDEFGGKTLKERSRFAVEVVKEMRKQAPDMVIILRLSQWKQQDYAVKLATTPGEMEDWILPLAEAGVDIFHGSQRRYWEPEFEGSDLNLAGWFKKITGQPSITVGSVGLKDDVMGMFTKGEGSGTSDLNELMRRYDRGDFDLVAVGRAVLQDPEWVLKVKEKRFEDIEAFSAASLSQLY
jgi:2,4-dienoyl-CoA reductase-like NADH-dependent reductase (Old Yellow Enzyme family)